MRANTNALEIFLADENNFIVKLRNLEGLDKGNIEVLIDILNRIGIEIENIDVIEKKLAFLLVEIEPTLLSVASYYDGDILRAILDEIARISMKISAILEC